MDKATYRRQMKEIRRSIPAEIRAMQSELILAHLLQSQVWKDSKMIGSYASFRGEVNTWPILERAAATQKAIALPRVVGTASALQFHHVVPSLGEWPLTDGAFGVREPDTSCPVVPLEALELLLVPALAVSPAGARIGWGGGFYDRTLLATPKAKRIALVFHSQIRPDVPTSVHDQPIDGWVSEEGLFWV